MNTTEKELPIDIRMQDMFLAYSGKANVKKLLSKEFISKAVIANPRALFAQVYDGTQESANRVKEMYMRLVQKPDEMVFYENNFSQPVTVTCHRGIPRLVEPMVITPKNAEPGVFLVRVYIFLRSSEAVERAAMYIASIDESDCTPEDGAIKTYAKQHFDNMCPVLFVEYAYTAKDLAERGGVVYDPMLNIVLQFGTGAMDGFVRHPAHSFDAENVLNTFSPTPLAGVSVKYTTEKKTGSLFIKLGSEVVELKPKIGLPIRIAGKNKGGLVTTSDYISITKREQDGTQTTRHHTLEYAKEHLAVFDSRQVAEAAGDYKSSLEAKWLVEKDKHERALAVSAQTHRQELDSKTQAVRLEWETKFNAARHEAEKSLSDERLRHAQLINELKVDLEKAKKAHADIVRIFEQETAKSKARAEERENAHKAEIEKLKLSQQVENNRSDRDSNSSRNTGDGISLAAKIIGGALAVGAVVYKLFF